MKKKLMAVAVAAVMVAQPTASFAAWNSASSGLCNVVSHWHWVNWISCAS